MSASTGIGAVVITRNESAHVEGCLRALAFCDERVVVDSFSDDDTVERARPHAEHVYRRTFLDFADQKQWGVDRLDTAWVLVVDADERVGRDLAEELCALARAGERDGYWILRRNRFFGKVIHGAGWQRDRVLRFHRRGAARQSGAFVHEDAEPAADVRVGTCRHRLDHHTYEDWPSTFRRLLDYTSRGAAVRVTRGRRGSAWAVGLRPLGRFVMQYLLRGGFRDGIHGYVLCVWSAIGVFVREAKLRAGETTVRTAPATALRVEVVQGRRPDGSSTPDDPARREGRTG